MNGLMIFADGFEDSEGLTTLDVLRRAKMDICCVSLSSNNYVITSANNKVEFDISYNEIDYKEFDFLIIPGGKAVFNVLIHSLWLNEVITYFATNNKLICAICAAPMLIGRLGFLNGYKYTCFPGCEANVVGGELINQNVVFDRNIISAKSMYYSCDFALKIIEVLKGKNESEIIERQIKGLE